MAPSKGGAPRKRGTAKVHTTQRLEVGDKKLLEAYAKAASISTPDMIHALCEGMRLSGSDAAKVATLNAEVVRLTNLVEDLRRAAASFRQKAIDAHEKNFYLSQRVRALTSAFNSLPAAALRHLPERMLEKTAALLQAHAVSPEERAVLGA